MPIKEGLKTVISGNSTPVFPSPVPTRKKFDYIWGSGKSDSCYPNCDAGVWLRSCEEEIIQSIEGKIKGKIPIWLKGSLVRNGPGLLKVGDDSFKHLFDGSALLHRFEIKDGKVGYQSRFLQSDVFKKNMEAKRIVRSDFATKAVADPCHSIFKRVAAVFSPEEVISDNSMTSVYAIGDDIYAFGDGPIIHKVNVNDLNVDAKVNMYESIGIVNHSSHPHVEADGTVFNLGMTVNLTGPYHNIVRFRKSETSEDMFERAKIEAKFPARWPLNPSYMHSFGLTEHYFIIVEQPLSLSVPSLINSKLQNDPMIGSLRWHENEMVQINVICRKTNKRVRKFFSEAFFYLHIINQYEKDDHIVLDICAYRDAAMISCMYIEALQDMQTNPDYATMFRAKPLRFMLPMGEDLKEQIITFPNSDATAEVSADGTVIVQPEIICNIGCEIPRINYERYLGKEYRYFYGISADIDADNPGTVFKVDTKQKTCLTWCEDNCYPSEPIFVPRPDSQDEDDGIILSAMIWASPDTNRVGMLVLDAKTLVEIGRAEFSTPGPVPKCFHGWFLPE